MLSVAQLGGDEDFFSRNSGGCDRSAHACFVAIGGGRVDVPATGFQRSFHHALRLILRDLEDAEAELGNTDPVVQRQVRDGDHDTSRTGSSLLAMYAASRYQLASTTQREQKRSQKSVGPCENSEIRLTSDRYSHDMTLFVASSSSRSIQRHAPLK